MCGICGVFGYTGRQEDYRDRLSMMSGMLAHRGPDDSGSFWGDRVGLAHRRLSIIDVTGGRQPMSNEDGSVWITYNGEVYNFRELRAELTARGHRFASGSDTEVIIHLYEEEGEDSVARLNGMFAFALWDARRGMLMLARDRVGIKPLYYSERPDGFFFSSELGSLVAGTGVSPALDPSALCMYLLLQYVPGTQTILEGFKRLAPGHLLCLDNAGPRLRKYWTPDSETRVPGPVAGPDDIRGLLEEAVRRQLVSDVPLGAFLSGGLDSSAVVAMMRRFKDGPVKTFSIGFEGPSAFDERPYARAVASRLGTEHYDTSMSPADFAGLMPGVVGAMDEPVADPAAVPTLKLSALAREHVKVVMTGEGGDELFGGYRRYALEAAGGRLPGARISWRLVARSLAAVSVSDRRLHKAARALGSDGWSEAHLNWVTVFLKEELLRLAPDMCGNAWEDASAWFGTSAAAGRDRLGNMMACDLVSWLPDDLFVKVDRMSMSVSLEARVPYLDNPLMQAAIAVDSRDRIRAGSGKQLLKRAMRGVLPDEVIDRKKRGFDLPLGVWFRGELKGYVRDTLEEQCHGAFTGFDRSFVGRMLDEHETGRKDWSLQLFSLLVFKLWAGRTGV
jgi:asparagine synthase (glutamine-hydrolysing)